MAGSSVVRVSLLGTMPGGEVWSVNPCFFLLDEPADVTGTEVLAIANAVRAIAVPTGLKNLWNGTTQLNAVRVEARDREGILNAQAEGVLTSPGVGSGVNPHPYQTSTVTSLRTAYPGAQGRGRLYWPATGIAVDASNLRANSSAITSALTAVKGYLQSIETAVAASAGPARLSVWSRTGTAFHGVTELRQGDVLDVQRRRRDALAESYNAVAYP